MKLNKLINDFFNISLSEIRANRKYTNEEIRSYLTAISLNNDSLESATGISPDTILRRLNLGNEYDLPWLTHYNNKMLEILPHIINRNKRVRWSLIIDESLEPYFGNFKELKADLIQKGLPDFVTNYQIQRGSTSSFHYIVIALYSKLGTFPICVLPNVCYADKLPIYDAVLREVRRIVPEITLLADRGFGNQDMIELCQRHKLNYCIRLKKNGKLKMIKKKGRNYFWHKFGDIKFRVAMHKSHGRETFFFAVGKKAGASQWFRLLYKDRWSIENLFKNGDRNQIRTNSRNSIFRLFCFTLSMFLLLLYQIKKIFSKKARNPIRKTLYDVFSIKVLVILKVT